MRSTIADVQRWISRDSHPTWIHAAYADLATRLARVEDMLEQLGDSMSLLHSKMEMIIGQLAVHEHQEEPGRDA